jgi:hypothetical protein
MFVQFANKSGARNVSPGSWGLTRTNSSVFLQFANKSGLANVRLDDWGLARANSSVFVLCANKSEPPNVGLDWRFGRDKHSILIISQDPQTYDQPVKGYQEQGFKLVCQRHQWQRGKSLMTSTPQLIHDEVCTKAFMEELRDLVKHASSEDVKQKILEMLQTWGMAFRNQSKYRIVTVRFRTQSLGNTSCHFLLPGPNFKKLFTSVICECLLWVRVFVPDKPF